MYSYFLYPAFILAILFSFYAQIKVSKTFRRYADFHTQRGRMAADVAKNILTSNGIHNVSVERVPGNLTDHYDPRAKVLRLSDSVFSSSSASAIGVAAHEAGHAVQHAVGYLPIKIRTSLVPITNFASRMSWIVILLGALISIFAYTSNIGYYMVMGGTALFSVTALFQLVTLPTEYNASARALKALDASGTLTREELAKAKKVLSAAALTYVAALLVSLMQLLRLLLMVSRNDRRR
jgi:Zn-dependent membrane protease YugP